MNGLILFIPMVIAGALLFFILREFFYQQGKYQGNSIFYRSTLGVIVFIMIFLLSDFDKSIIFQQWETLTICLILILTMLIIWHQLLHKQRLKWSVLAIFFLILFVVQSRQINASLGTNAFFFTDPGPINTVNTLRGEDHNLLGILVHNRSILVYKYLENIAFLFNPAFIVQQITVLLFFPLLLGAYQLVGKKYYASEVLAAYLLATLITLGFVRQQLLDKGFFLLLPIITILIVIGITKVTKI